VIEKMVRYRCPHCGNSLEIPPTPPKPPKANDVGYTNLDSMLQCPVEARKDIENWLRQPHVFGPADGYSNLESEKTGIGQGEVARQKRMGFA